VLVQLSPDVSTTKLSKVNARMPPPNYMIAPREMSRLILKLDRELMARTQLRRLLLSGARNLAESRAELQDSRRRARRRGRRAKPRNGRNKT
jgi:hypothetical protein